MRIGGCAIRLYTAMCAPTTSLPLHDRNSATACTPTPVTDAGTLKVTTRRVTRFDGAIRLQCKQLEHTHHTHTHTHAFRVGSKIRAMSFQADSHLHQHQHHLLRIPLHLFHLLQNV